MKQSLSFFAIAAVLIIAGCKQTTMSGVYVCDASKKKPDTIINHGSSAEAFMDFTCTIQELDFRGNSTVVLKINNAPMATSYIVDKNYIRVSGTGAAILFKIEDNKTLSGEGVFEGVYHKK